MPQRTTLDRRSTVAVEVRLHGQLRLLRPDHAGPHVLSLAAGARVDDLLQQLGAGGEAWLVAINGAAARRQDLLQDGDQVDMYPQLEGG